MRPHGRIPLPILWMRFIWTIEARPIAIPAIGISFTNTANWSDATTRPPPDQNGTALPHPLRSALGRASNP